MLREYRNQRTDINIYYSIILFLYVSTEKAFSIERNVCDISEEMLKQYIENQG